MRIAESTTIRAPLHTVWERISDPTHWPRELGRMHCSHLAGSPQDGPGARYWLHLEVGAAEVGSLIEILEYEPGSALSWTTIQGLEQRGHWRLRDRGDGHTEVTLTVSYQAAGGLAALLTDEISSLPVRRYLRDALSALSRRLEDASAQKPAGGASGLVHAGSGLLGDAAHAARVLTRARLMRPARPDRYARALALIAQRRQSIAGSYPAAAALHPDEPAVIDDQGTLTFTQLNERTSRLANALSGHGINAGGSVAVMCRSHRGQLETLVASSKLGADTLLLDTQLAAAQLREVIKSQRPRAIVYDSEFAEQLRPSLRGRKGFIAWTEPPRQHRRSTLEELIAEGDADAPPPRRQERHTTIITAEKTGTPARTSLTSLPLSAALALLAGVPLRSRERVLLAAPLASAWGLAHLDLAGPLASTLVLQREHDPEATLAAIARERISYCATLPDLLAQILELAPRVRHRYNTSSLRGLVVNGTLPAALASGFIDEYGEILYSLYGTTELGWLTAARPADLRRAPGTAGRALRGTTVRVLDEDGAQVRAGRTGHIFITNAMLEHRNDPASQTRDRLIATGEVGHLDDHGRLFLHGGEQKASISRAETLKEPSRNDRGKVSPARA